MQLVIFDIANACCHLYNIFATNFMKIIISTIFSELLLLLNHYFNCIKFIKNSTPCFTRVNNLPQVAKKMSSVIHFKPFTSNFIFRQLFDAISCTYTYLLACADSAECILIDPVVEHARRDFQITRDLNLKLLFAVNTHMHADHITGTGYLKKLSGCRSMISRRSGAQADVLIEENDFITFGNHRLQVLSTPGHTNGCCSFYSEPQGIAFTGDALLIRGCGRTDFQEGNSETLYRNVHDKIFSLPRNTRLYPAHDYRGLTVTSVDEELRLNPRLTKSLEEFVKIMDNLDLAYPSKIDKALPANKACGLYNIPSE